MGKISKTKFEMVLNQSNCHLMHNEMISAARLLTNKFILIFVSISFLKL